MDSLRSAPITTVLTTASLLSLLAACSDGPIVLRSQADRHIQAPTDTDDPDAAECQQVRDQIRANQEALREAPSISTSPQIVEAAQGRADQRIDDLRTRLDTLGCNNSKHAADASDSRLPPLPAAPNGPNR